jgi:hypothetical protein
MTKLKEKRGVLIEYNGNQHFYPISWSKTKHSNNKNFISCIRRDHIKFNYCRKFSIPLLVIPFWDFDRIEEILDDVLSGRMPTFTETPEIVKNKIPLRAKIRSKLGITEPEVLCGYFNNSYSTIFKATPGIETASTTPNSVSIGLSRIMM